MKPSRDETGDYNGPSDRSRELDEAVAAYLRASESGQAGDRQEWLARYPHLAADLAAFFADHDMVGRLATPLSNRPIVDLSTQTETIAPEGNGSPGAARSRVRYFGDYELVDEIARGGMGVVYEARQINLGRRVALKMILAGHLASAADVQRFYTEAQAAAGLDHPNIVPIYEIGMHGDQHYFSMAFVAGESLAAKVVGSPLPPQQAAELTEKVAQAIAFAHARGVIHRDLKPANILVDHDGEPKVTDFGLAKKIETESELTHTGAILGTPSYMPPEQAAGKVVGPAADIYSLGAILYCLLTGRPPFQAASPLDTLLQVIGDEPVAPRQLNPKLPRDLETICLKCLRKEPTRRYESAQALVEDLACFRRGEPIKARPTGLVERGAKWVRRRPVVAGLTTAVLALLMVIVIAGPLAAVRQANLRWTAEEAKGESQLQTLVAYEGLAKAEYARATTLWTAREEDRQEKALQAIGRAVALRGPMETLSRDVPNWADGMDWPTRTAEFWRSRWPQLNQEALRWNTEASLQKIAEMRFDRSSANSIAPVSSHGEAVMIQEGTAPSVSAIHPEGKYLARYQAPSAAQPERAQNVQIVDLRQRLVVQAFDMRPTTKTEPEKPVPQYDSIGLGFSPGGKHLLVAWREVAPDLNRGFSVATFKLQFRELPSGVVSQTLTLPPVKVPPPPGVDPKAEFHQESGPARSVIFSPDGSRVAIGPTFMARSQFNTGVPTMFGAASLAIYDTASAKLLWSQHDAGFAAGGFTPRGNELFGLRMSEQPGRANAVEFHDAATGRETRRIPLEFVDAGSLTPQRLALSPDGKFLALTFPHVNNTLQIVLLDAATGKPIVIRPVRQEPMANFTGGMPQVPADALLAFIPNGKGLVVATPDRLHLLSVPEGALLANQPFAPAREDGGRNFGSANAVPRYLAGQIGFLGQGTTFLVLVRQLATGLGAMQSGTPTFGPDEAAQFWDLSIPRLTLTKTVLHDDAIDSVTLSADERMIYVAGGAFTAINRETSSGPTLMHVSSSQGELDTGRTISSTFTARWSLRPDPGPQWFTATESPSGMGFDSVDGSVSGFGRSSPSGFSGERWFLQIEEAPSRGVGRSLKLFDVTTGKQVASHGQVAAVSADRRLVAMHRGGIGEKPLTLVVAEVEALAKDPQAGRLLPADLAQGAYNLTLAGEYALGIRQSDQGIECLIAKVADGSLVARIPMDNEGARGAFVMDPARRKLLVARPWNRNDPAALPKHCIVELANGKVLAEFPFFRTRDGNPAPAAFSADGESLAFLSAEPFRPDGSSQTHVELWSAKTGESRRITHDFEVPPFVYLPWTMRLGRNGACLAMVAPEVEKQTNQVRLVFELWETGEPKLLYSSASRPGSVSQFRLGAKTVAVDFQPEPNNNSNLRCDLVDLADGKRVADFPGRRSVSLAPDGEHLLLDLNYRSSLPGGENAPQPPHPGMLLVEMATGKPHVKLEGYSAPTMWPPNGKRLIVLSPDHTRQGPATIWDLATGEKRSVAANLLGPDISGISPDSRLGMSYNPGEGSELALWDLNVGRTLGSLNLALPTAPAGKPGPMLNSLSWSADARRLAVNVNGQIRLFETSGKGPYAALPRPTHMGKTSSVAASADGRLIATASLDRTVGLWNQQDGSFAGLLEGYTSEVVAASFHPTAPQLFTRDLEGAVLAWELDFGANGPIAGVAGKLLWRATAGPGRNLIVSKDGRYLATQGPGGGVLLLESKGGKVARKLAGVSMVNRLAFSADGGLVATAGGDGKVKLWTVADGQPAGEWDTQQGELSAVSFSPDGKLLATGGIAIRLWHVEQGRLVVPLEQHSRQVRSLAFTADGKQLLSAGDDRQVVTWDVENLRRGLGEIGLGW